MGKLARTFYEGAHVAPVPGGGEAVYNSADNPERALRDADEIGRHFANMVEFIGGLVDAQPVFGKNKDAEKAVVKAERDYGGGVEFVTDYRRAKLAVDGPRYRELKTFLKDRRDYLELLFGARLVQETDYFETPHQLTGYMADTLKLQFELEDGGWHVTELQLVDPEIERLYDFTHGHKEAAEAILAEKPAGQPLRDGAEKEFDGHLAIVRYFHNAAAIARGYKEAPPEVVEHKRNFLNSFCANNI